MRLFFDKYFGRVPLVLSCALGGLCALSIGCGESTTASTGADGAVAGETTATAKHSVDEAALHGTVWSLKSEFLYASLAAAAPDGTIYFGAWDSKFRAINPDGSEKWSVVTEDKINRAPAVAEDGTVIFASWDKKVYARTPDGDEKWTFQADSLVDVSPSIDDEGRVLFVSDKGTFYRLDADGELLDEFSLPDAPTTSISIFNDDGERHYFVGGADNALYCLTDDQLEAGEYSRSDALTGHPVDDIAVSRDGFVFLGTTQGHIVKISHDCSDVSFSESLTWAPLSAPALDGDGNIYVGLLNDHIARIDPEDGALVWSESTRRGAPLLAAPTLSDSGKFYGGTNGLVSFDTDGDLTVENDLDILTSPLLVADAAYATTESGHFVRLDVELGEVGESDWPIQHANAQRTGYLER